MTTNMWCWWQDWSATQAHVTVGNGACRERIIEVIQVGAFDAMMATLEWVAGASQGEIL
jgi:hypothetical protein